MPNLPFIVIQRLGEDLSKMARPVAPATVASVGQQLVATLRGLHASMAKMAVLVGRWLATTGSSDCF